MSVPNRLDRNKPGDRMLGVQGMSDLTHAERTVLSVIAWHDGPGTAFPSMERIAALAGGMHRSTVVEHRKALRDKGRLSWSKGQRGSIYTVDYGDVFIVRDSLTTEPDGGESHRQGIPASHRQGFPDANRKEPDPGTEERLEGWDAEPVLQIPYGWDWNFCPECKVLRGHDYKFPAGSENCLVCGYGRDLPDEPRCRSPELCQGMMDERERCRICGADQ